MFTKVLKMVSVASLVFGSTCRCASQTSQQPQPYSVIGRHFDFSSDTTSVVSFIWEAANGPHVAALRDVSGDLDRPFFILYEGNEVEWTWPSPEQVKGQPGKQRYMVPVQTGKHFAVSNTSATIEEAFIRPLTNADPSLRAFLRQNVLMIQDSAVVAGTWPLNRIVDECSSTSLTAGEAERLLRDKYGWNLVDADGKPQAFCQYANDVVMPRTSERVSVRDLLVAVLRQASIRVYPQARGNWIGAFQVKDSDPGPRGERRWAVIVLSGGPPKK